MNFSTLNMHLFSTLSQWIPCTVHVVLVTFCVKNIISCIGILVYYGANNLIDSYTERDSLYYGYIDK